MVGGASSAKRKPIYLIAFAVLPLRGLLYTLSNNPYFLVAVQVLDGIGSGTFGVMLLVIADWQWLAFSLISKLHNRLILFLSKPASIKA